MARRLSGGYLMLLLPALLAILLLPDARARDRDAAEQQRVWTRQQRMHARTLERRETAGQEPRAAPTPPVR